MIKKLANLWALALLAMVLLGVGAFVIFAVRSQFSPWLASGIIATIFNFLLLVYSLSKPLRTKPEIRRLLHSAFVEAWFYIISTFALAGGHFIIAAVSLIGGGVVHIFFTRKRVNQSRRLST